MIYSRNNEESKFLRFTYYSSIMSPHRKLKEKRSTAKIKIKGYYYIYFNNQTFFLQKQQPLLRCIVKKLGSSILPTNITKKKKCC